MKIEYPVKAPYSLTVESLVKAMSTVESNGLSDAEASIRSKQFGPNVYKSQKQKSLWRMAFDQFNSPIVYLLFLAAFASLYFKNHLPRTR